MVWTTWTVDASPLFVASRLFTHLCAGIALGGEVGCAFVMVYEYSPRSHVGFACSVAQAGYGMGAAVAAGAVGAIIGPGHTAGPHLLTSTPLSLAWRSLLALALPLVLLGVYIRIKVPEPPPSVRIHERGFVETNPIGKMVRYPWTIICCILFLFSDGILRVLFVP